MPTKTQDIRIEEYDYSLPEERIAKFPLPKRDESKLLLYKDGVIGESVFKHITDYLPEDSLVVYNNTRVIRARMLFNRVSGAKIEVFCLEPSVPNDYTLSFHQKGKCSWICMVGNLRKWGDELLYKNVLIEGKVITISANRLRSYGQTNQVEFAWPSDYTFAEILDAAGELPIPPYLNRKTEESDLRTYQTVYSKIEGSVAAPTAGLHFTPEVLAAIDAKGIKREELTLHVGAGTFKPVKSETIEGHEMHTEFISVNKSIIESVLANLGKVIAVGTTSVRTLESLYYIGVLLSRNPKAGSHDLIVGQWMPYDEENNRLSAEDALRQILSYLEAEKLDKLVTSTRILIAPGYNFKIVKGIITNFHQPKSTLLLLISAFVNGKWKDIYDYALTNDFRFLSYGDSSLLLC